MNRIPYVVFKISKSTDPSLRQANVENLSQMLNNDTNVYQYVEEIITEN